jgi:hypothetical protein
MRRWLVYLLSLPPSLAGLFLLGVLLLLRAVRVRKTRGEDTRGKLIVCALPGGWVARWWRYSTTFGPHAVLLQPDADEYVLAHEIVHCRQAEGASLAWLLGALASWDARMLAAWPLCFALAYTGAALAAWLSGRDSYEGNTFEDHAYAVQRELERKR